MTCDRNTALCTKVHRAVKTLVCINFLWISLVGTQHTHTVLFTYGPCVYYTGIIGPKNDFWRNASVTVGPARIFYRPFRVERPSIGRFLGR